MRLPHRTVFKVLILLTTNKVNSLKMNCNAENECVTGKCKVTFNDTSTLSVVKRVVTVCLNNSLRSETGDNAVLLFFGEILSSQQTTLFVGHTEGTGGSNATFRTERFCRLTSCHCCRRCC